MGNGGASGILIAGLCAGLTFSPVFAACTPGVVDIRGAFGQARFSVEVADTGEERAQGLMATGGGAQYSSINQLMY